MFLSENQKNMLETPCVVIDREQTVKNIKEEQEAVGKNGTALRPHIKTHKMPYFAKLQLEAGAGGITSCKVSEALIMADGGCDDIFIAYPLIGRFRFEKAAVLQKKVKRLILAVDSLEGAEMLNSFAQEKDIIFEVRLEVDTGAKRTGIAIEKSVELGKKIDAMSNLNLTGIYTFKSLSMKDGTPTTDNDAAAKEEAELMHNTAVAMREAGLNIVDISAGSTPTGRQVAESGLVTEVRQGTYIFKDYMLTKENCGKLEDIAVRIFATVVSTPCEEYAVIDGGTKTFPMDILLDTAPAYYPGYAIPLNGDGSINDNLQLRRMNEEHGIITAKNGHTGLKVGEIVELLPIHVCTAVNMQNEVYIKDGEKLWKQKVDARGTLV
ncbi:MAG: alanine racemase [Clostridia bacterium]|nr:alanine racemase [Clostridia bacterium]